jgi:hypothetical protein
VGDVGDEAVRRPKWWLSRYPGECRSGHSWYPGRVIISFVPCPCAGGSGHVRVRCLASGCHSVWYQPPHKPGSEITGQPGGAAMR